MPDAVAYTLWCDCGDMIYAAHHMRLNSAARTPAPILVTQYWPEIHHDNASDPITHCANCGADVMALDERMS